jgi:class 3 adenylate cyclase
VIPDEPARGRIPPPWFGALDGIERMRASARGQIPWAPLGRLLGMRLTHVVPGGVNVTMPAAEASLAANGQLEVVPLLMTALECATQTAVPAGIDAIPLRFAIEPFRPAWARPGNLLARARVVNSGNLFVFAEVQVEDPDGRHIAQGSLRCALRRIEPPPPPPPDTLNIAEEPVYESPDPYLRRFAATPALDFMEHEDGLTLLRRWSSGSFDLPIAVLYGIRCEVYDAERTVISIPASEWFCGLRPGVAPAVIAAFGDTAGWASAMTLHRPGESIAGLDGATRFYYPVPADGRRLHAETRVTEQAANIFVAETHIRDADGRPVAHHTGSVTRLSASERQRRYRKETRRVLATLLFTDIVDSTRHAERLGDARWRALLEEHRLTVRREMSRFNGIEVDTAGDGFFLRFDSPAQAVEAARAAVGATARLGIQIRAGVHSGECEIEGNKPAGMAVHIAARIQAAAGPGEVLVSSTVKDLATGSSLRFADRGEHTLKGVPEPWRIFAVVD